MDGRSCAAGTGKAASCGSGGGGGVAYEARGYKQGWADKKAGKTGKPTAQIEPSLVYSKVEVCFSWLAAIAYNFPLSIYIYYPSL